LADDSPTATLPAQGLRRRLQVLLESAGDKRWVQLVRGSGFIFGCRVTGAVLALVTQWVLARWLGAENLGSYLFAYSWMIIVARLSGLGLNSAAPRFIGEGLALGNRGQVRGFIGFSGRTVLGVSTAAAAAGITAALLWDGGPLHDPWPLVVAFSSVPVMALIGVLQGIAIAYSWFRPAFIPNTVLRPALFLAVVSGLWWTGRSVGVTAVLLIQLGSLVLALLLLVAGIGGPLKRGLAGATPRVDASLWTSTAAALLIISLFRDYLPELSIIVAGLYLSPDEVAIFSIAFKVSALTSFVLFSVDNFTLPLVARSAAVGDMAGMEEAAQRATRLTVLGSMAALVGFWFGGRWALSLFGAEFVDGYRLLLTLAVAQVIRAAVGPVLPLLTVGGHERESLKVLGASLLLVGPLVVLLAPAWGAEGVGAAVAAAIVLSSLALNHRVRHLMGVRPSILAVLWGRSAVRGRR
jgi:O-antigen/teichoic acid export membrane protein